MSRKVIVVDESVDNSDVLQVLQDECTNIKEAIRAYEYQLAGLEGVVKGEKTAFSDPKLKDKYVSRASMYLKNASVACKNLDRLHTKVINDLVNKGIL